MDYVVDSEYDSADSGEWEILTTEHLERLYADLGRQRLFTKENIRFMDEQAETLHREFVEFVNHHRDYGGLPANHGLFQSWSSRLIFKDAFGNGFRYQIPYYPWLYGVCDEVYDEPRMVFYPYQALYDPGNKCALTFERGRVDGTVWIQPESIVNVSRKGRWVSLAEKLIPIIYSYDCRIPVDKDARLHPTKAAEFKKIWENRVERHKIILAAKEIKTPIKHIVCFGLGSLRLSTHPNINHRTFGRLERHFGVFDMAYNLCERSEMSGTPGRKIRVLFQDSDYDDDDKAYLKSIADGFEIEFLKSPKGLYELTDDTFVYCPGDQAFPIYQLVADLTVGFGGPAAVLWHTVLGARSRTMKGEKKVYTVQDEVKDKFCCPLNPVNRYVVEMLKGYEKVFDMEKTARYSEFEGSSLYVKKQAVA